MDAIVLKKDYLKKSEHLTELINFDQHLMND